VSEIISLIIIENNTKEIISVNSFREDEKDFLILADLKNIIPIQK